MIRSLREKLSGTVAVAIIVLIAIPLAFIGLDSLFLTGNKISNIGSVNGKGISEIDFARAVAARETQVAQLLGENYNAEIVDQARIESAALSGLVDLNLLLDHAEEGSMGYTEEFVVGQIRQAPEFQVDGQFSDALFSSYMGQLGFTASTFIDALGEEIVSSQLRVGLQTSTIATQQMIENAIAVSQEKRNYQTLLLPVEAVLDSVEVNAEEISAFYQENTEQFEQPERVSLNYVQLSASNFLDDVEVTRDEVEQRFAAVKSSLPARRQAAHILIESESDDSHFAVLDEIQLELENGVAFEELAEKYSSDIGSAGNGGLLGFTDGNAFPAAFESALAALEVDAVSAPVLTDAGFHIIKLVSIDEETFELEDEYANIESEIRLQKATDVYRRNLERFTEASFSTDNLEQLIADFASIKELEVASTPLFVRSRGEGIAANDTVRAAAFSNDVLVNQYNSEAIEIDDASAVIVHLRDRIEPGVAALEEVSDEIGEILKVNKGTILLESRAAEIEARLNAGDDMEEVASEEDVEWEVQLDVLRGAGGVAGRSVFAAEIDGDFPIIGSDVQPNGDYLIYSIDSVAKGSLDDFNEAQVSQLAIQMSQLVAEAENNAYINTLRDEADIDFKIDVEY